MKENKMVFILTSDAIGVSQSTLRASTALKLPFVDQKVGLTKGVLAAIEAKSKFSNTGLLSGASMALALSACGGETTTTGTSTSTNTSTGSGSGTGANASVELNYSSAIDFSSLSEDLQVPLESHANTYWEAQRIWGASEFYYAIMSSPNIVHIQSVENSDILLLPSWYDSEPFLPAVTLTFDEDQTFSLGSIDEQATIGWARNWHEIIVNDETMMVIADTGHELTTGKDTWLKGDVWLVDFQGGGNFELTAISGPNAFYHDIDVGDINGDGLDDILAINMSFILGADPYPLHVFLQDSGGNFTQQLGFMSFTNDLPMLGGAAGALIDVDNNGSLEIIQTAYTVRDFSGWDMDHAFRVYGMDQDGEFDLQFSATRSGKAEMLGSSNVYDADIDLDGDLDIILYMEGANAVSDITGSSENYKQGIQIWENNGDLTFSEVTDDWLDISVWSNSEFSIRDYSIADLNGDGYQDIFLNGYGPNVFHTWETPHGEINLGSYIFLNNNGQKFEHLKDVPELVLEKSSGKGISHIRLYQVNEDSFEVFLTNQDNTFGIVEVDFGVFNTLIA